MLTMDQARQHAEEWIAAFNAHDLERVLALYADDVEIKSPLVTRAFGIPDGVMRGKAKVREFFSLGTKNPALHFELVDVLLGADALTVLYRNHLGALVADCEELNEQGKIQRMVASYGEFK